jgi:CO/xanthine dehydrogenase Mo-binding subunit
VILNRPGLPFLSSGETVTGPTPAAIANAVFNASGIGCVTSHSRRKKCWQK